MSLSIIFAGTPEFSVPALEALLRSRHRVVAVYTQPDRPAGRGRELVGSAVKACAVQHGIAVEQPARLRNDAAVEALARYAADVMVVVAYGLLLPPRVLATPRLGCVNIHASILPRWRGAAPIQRAIEAGDATSGVTIMQMDAGLDTGPILLERALPLDARETARTLHDRLAPLGATLLLEALEGLTSASLASRPQPASGASYAAKIRKEEARIDWTRPAIELDRKVRAFDPWPVAETTWRGEQLRVWAATPEVRANSSEPGTVLATGAGIDVATGDGVLRLTRVQVAGRKAMPAAEFVRAHAMEGAVLGSNR